MEYAMAVRARRFTALSKINIASTRGRNFILSNRGHFSSDATPVRSSSENHLPPAKDRARCHWPAGLAAALWGALWGGAALAGGYVAPILELAPAAPIATAGTASNWWMALVPLFLIALAGRADRGDNGLTPLPGDYGGPCFGEGTLIQLERGWVPVQMIEAGERIVTSRGPQTILAVESWRPVEYRDRPFVVGGVRLSPNHGVAAGEIIVPACRLSTARSPIDGGSYFHILVADHSWLYAKAEAEAPAIWTESLCMTADLKLARKFPDLVARHAADPVAPVRVGIKDSAIRTAA